MSRDLYNYGWIANGWSSSNFKIRPVPDGGHYDGARNGGLSHMLQSLVDKTRRAKRPQAPAGAASLRIVSFAGISGPCVGHVVHTIGWQPMLFPFYLITSEDFLRTGCALMG